MEVLLSLFRLWPLHIAPSPPPLLKDHIWDLVVLKVVLVGNFYSISSSMVVAFIHRKVRVPGVSEVLLYAGYLSNTVTVWDKLKVKGPELSYSYQTIHQEKTELS